MSDELIVFDVWQRQLSRIRDNLNGDLLEEIGLIGTEPGILAFTDVTEPTTNRSR